MKGQLITGCGNKAAFTGLGSCALFESTPKAIILTTYDFVVPAGTANVGEYLRTQALIPMNSKVFPLMEGLVNLEPSGGDVRTSQEGFGESSVNGHNPYQEVLTFTKGGLCMLKELLSLHGQQMRVFFVDDNNVAYGTTDESNAVFGYSITIGVHRRKNVGTTPAAIIVTLLYSNNNYTEVRNMTSFEIPSNLKGIRRIHAKIVSYSRIGPTAATLVVKFFTACSGVDVTKEIVTYNEDEMGAPADFYNGVLKGYTDNSGSTTLHTSVASFAIAHDHSTVTYSIDDGTWEASEVVKPKAAIWDGGDDFGTITVLKRFGFGVDGELY